MRLGPRDGAGAGACAWCASTEYARRSRPADAVDDVFRLGPVPVRIEPAGFVQVIQGRDRSAAVVVMAAEQKVEVSGAVREPAQGLVQHAFGVGRATGVSRGFCPS